jgi:poly-gamma-glutamate synthesis protein (capsule biosynthesis protein)
LLDTDIGRVALVAMDGGPAPDSYRALDATDKVPARPGVNALRVNTEVIVSKEELATLRAIEDEIGHRRMQRVFRKKSESDMGADGLDFYGLRFRVGARHRKQGIPDEADVAQHLAAIERAKSEARFVVAYLHHHHWDADWADVPDWERDFAKHCVDAGADAYVSHGVPLLQPIEMYKGRPLFYSLGNFIFHSASAEGWFHDHIWQSVVATCRFGADGSLDGIEFDPIVIGGEAALDTKDFSAREAPHRAGPKAAEEILSRLADLSAPMGTAIDIRDGRGYIG